MPEIDDFDALYDEFKEENSISNKKLQSVGVTNTEQLPLWSEVKATDDEYACLVCRKNIGDEDIVEACVSCKQFYHYRHIREWIKIKAVCPNCKAKM